MRAYSKVIIIYLGCAVLLTWMLFAFGFVEMMDMPGFESTKAPSQPTIAIQEPVREPQKDQNARRDLPIVTAAPERLHLPGPVAPTSVQPERVPAPVVVPAPAPAPVAAKPEPVTPQPAPSPPPRQITEPPPAKSAATPEAAPPPRVETQRPVEIAKAPAPAPPAPAKQLATETQVNKETDHKVQPPPNVPQKTAVAPTQPVEQPAPVAPPKQSAPPKTVVVPPPPPVATPPARESTPPTPPARASEIAPATPAPTPQRPPPVVEATPPRAPPSSSTNWMPARRIAGFGADALVDQLEEKRRPADDLPCVVFDQVKFRASTAQPFNGSAREIALIAETLAAFPSARVEIGSRIGTNRLTQANLNLAVERAAYVRNAIVARGIPSERLIVDTDASYHILIDDLTRIGTARAPSIGVCLQPPTS